MSRTLQFFFVDDELGAISFKVGLLLRNSTADQDRLGETDRLARTGEILEELTKSRNGCSKALERTRTIIDAH